MTRTVILMIIFLTWPRCAISAPIELPNGARLETVDFERHVAPLFSQLGCNGGACHGAFDGKGGFRLSLFGHDPAADYLALSRAALRPRVNSFRPAQSLLLQKPTMTLPHGGGRRLSKRSWQYEVLHKWIADGAHAVVESGEVVKLETHPAELTFQKIGQSQAFVVQAQFADGSRADVTPFCEFRAQDDSIATVDENAVVRSQRPGDTAIVATYLSRSMTVSAIAPVAKSDAATWPEVSTVNFIDEEILAKLRQLRLAPSELSNDAEFLRRATITTIGQLPSPAEVRRFLTNSSPDKRARKIDELLAHPLHPAWWATRLCDITGANLQALEGPDELRPKRAQMWHDWLKRRIAENTPFNEVARGILCATSRNGADIGQWIDAEASLIRAAKEGFNTEYDQRPVLDLFWRRSGDAFPVEDVAERVAAAFFGVQLQCARCHKHPFDRWTQNDYRAFANTFTQVRFGMSPDLRSAMVDLLEERRQAIKQGEEGPPIPRLQEVYLTERVRDLPDERTQQTLPPKALGGPELPLEGDRRKALFDWLADPSNPFFARNMVNRVWKHCFGVGLVEPVDGFSATNPPSHPALLERLASDFVEHGFNLRRLERMILVSSVWQLSCCPNTANLLDRRNFSRACVRPLPAEAAVDVLNCALGARENFGDDVPRNIRAVEIAPSQVGQPHVRKMFRLFGRPERELVCDCERPDEPSVRQTLFLMSDGELLQRMKTGRLKNLLDDGLSDQAVIEELFLASLSRFPNAQERTAALEHVWGSSNRQEAFVEVFWSLLNTREFITNH